MLPTSGDSAGPRRGRGKPGCSGPPGNRNAEKHGTYRLKAAVRDLGSRAIDRRTTVGRALVAWRRELIDDLGGPESVSTQQAALVDLLTREKLILDSLDAYLAELGGGIINRKRRALIPIVRERAQLADSFTRRLVALGLERRVREAPDVAAYLASRTTAAGAADGEGAQHRDVTDETPVADTTSDGTS